MLRKNILAVIAMVLLIMLSIPFAQSFSGSGGGFNVTGIVGYGADNGTGGGYSVDFGLYPQPVGFGTGGGYTVELGNYFNVTVEEAIPHIILELLNPDQNANFTKNQMSEFTVRLTCAPGADCGNITLVLDPV